MTAGNYTIYGPSIPTGNCGGRECRSSFTKSWNGGDRTAPGDNSPHPYSCTIDIVNPGVVKYYGSEQCFSNCFGGVGSPVPLPVFSSNDELELLSKLIQKVRTGDIHLGNFLGTQRETFRMILDRATRIRSGLHWLTGGAIKSEVLQALKRPNFNHVRRKGLTNDLKLSSTWLEISYGWLPLVQDVHEGAVALASAKEKFSKRRICVRRSVAGGIPVSSSPFNWSTGGWSRASKQIIYNLEPLSSGAELLQLHGVTDWKSVAWELTPWSFVVDWFVPIGSYLNAYNTLPLIRGDYVQTTTTKWKGYGVQMFAANAIMLSPPQAFSLSMTRSVGSGPLTVPIPSIKSPFSSDWRRSANAVSLLVQRFRR